MTPHPRDAEAFEYVVGTLPAAERAAFECATAADPGLLAAVRAWEERLVPLAERAPDVPPPPALRAAVTGRLDEAAAPSNVMAFPVSPELARLRRSRARWRGATAASGSIAAALALLLAADRLLPTAPAPGLVAVVNRSGELPALIVRVDPRAGVVQVRELAAETPADRSLELWSIVGSGPPRSLGLVRAGQATASIPEADRARLSGATLAVSVEPRGGSPTGAPTGPVLYQGRLVPEAP